MSPALRPDEASYYESLKYEMDVEDSVHCYQYQSVHTIIIFSYDDTIALGSSISCHGLFEAKTQLVISI